MEDSEEYTLWKPTPRLHELSTVELVLLAVERAESIEQVIQMLKDIQQLREWSTRKGEEKQMSKTVECSICHTQVELMLDDKINHLVCPECGYSNKCMCAWCVPHDQSTTD